MKTEAPIIGITPSHDTKTDDIFLHPTYLRAIKAAGGLPLVLPLEADEEDIRALLLLCGGFLFSGGPDITPFSSGKRPTPLRRYVAGQGSDGACPSRSGHGGQKAHPRDLPRRPDHQCGTRGRHNPGYPQPDRAGFPHCPPAALWLCFSLPPCQRVGWEPSGPSGRLPGQCPCSLSVNSIHHQSVGRLAPGLTACAEAPDGIIEAVEMPGYPFLLGVQWHPEYLWRTDPAAAGIFKGFVEACG